ncbi:MAG: DUF1553 domain-containing protein, partial [Pirellulales bacterium]
RPPRAMILEETPALCLYPPRIFQRGKPSNLGPEVPRQFLAVLSGDERRAFNQGSGRLELARAIVDRRNPLTARVMVNRVWLAHFGSALVPTPSDFGLRSDPPSHPELLDWLATRLMEQGWSIKQLHRTILLSSVYQQRSGDRAEASRIDPDNRLLWRMNRRRLDFESLRDALLAVAGQLDAGAGGLPVDIVNPPYSKRRTVYGYVDRTNLPGLFRTFDFAIPDTHSPQRYTTTVPQQALFLMNNPFVIEQARHLAARPEIAGQADPRRRIERLYVICFGRPPDPDEIELGLRYIDTGSKRRADPSLAAAWQYGYGEIDAATGLVKQFRPLPHWTGARWQGGPALPDPQLGWLMLEATGGHPGQGAGFAVIRRWKADRAGIVSISGSLTHGESAGDGIDGRIVGRAGQLAHWTIHNNRAATELARLEVQPGDVIDFIVTSRENVTCDQFTWSPTIRLAEASPAAAQEQTATEWDAARDFSGLGLTPLERYCHALLLMNEFVMLD